MTQDNNHSDLHTNSEEFSSFDEARPIGWSAGCLDEAIFYYLDCNYINMRNLEPDENIEK